MDLGEEVAYVCRVCGDTVHTFTSSGKLYCLGPVRFEVIGGSVVHNLHMPEPYASIMLDPGKPKPLWKKILRK